MRGKRRIRSRRPPSGELPSYLLPPRAGRVIFDPTLRRAVDAVAEPARLRT